MGRAVGGNSVIEARIAAAQGLSEADAHALAGLIDAEGTFTISPNNRGRSWRCSMTIALRDDDADILIDIARTTGLGRLNGGRRSAASPRSALCQLASTRAEWPDVRPPGVLRRVLRARAASG